MPVPIAAIVKAAVAVLSNEKTRKAVDLTFHGGVISARAPKEYLKYIADMRGSFGGLDELCRKFPR